MYKMRQMLYELRIPQTLSLVSKAGVRRQLPLPNPKGWHPNGPDQSLQRANDSESSANPNFLHPRKKSNFSDLEARPHSGNHAQRSRLLDGIEAEQLSHET